MIDGGIKLLLDPYLFLFMRLREDEVSHKTSIWFYEVHASFDNFNLRQKTFIVRFYMNVASQYFHFFRANRIVTFRRGVPLYVNQYIYIF